ncbi:hypothetical protein G7Y89_g521 [Cudoniella acicularis]|uniref:Tyrosinase copper-binding domain-containing protein n=1 Tax=Cudoniella acicularis TaxID=354080 RepID=A0A8H4RZS0_9HELO|nr:hypothetical protein G7Y89_g521 [Cudoniella acicularis]
MSAVNLPVVGAPKPSPAPADGPQLPHYPTRCFNLLIFPGSVPLRIEIRDLQNNFPDQWNLYLLGLDAFKKLDETSDLSYYGIAGIHGLPYRPWGGVQGDNQGGWQGYCTHTSILFAPWHRPYLALFEQTLYGIVQDIAGQFPTDTKARYQQAAITFRIPYWDWAANPPNGDGYFPNSVAAPTINVITPQSNGQTVQIPNPLYSYNFAPLNPVAGDFPDAPQRSWPNTLRYPSSTTSAKAISQEQQVLDAMASQFASLQGNVNILMNDPNYKDFAAFSNHAWETNDPSTFASLEDIHNSIHGDVGGNLGHMSELDYSAFDPVFWLHHVNVDRLFAIWQALNPTSYTIDKVDQSGTFVIQANSEVTDTTPLAPFADATGASYWTSDGARQTTTFNYAYPETQRWTFNSDADYQASVQTAVQTLYGGLTNQFVQAQGLNLAAIPATLPPVTSVKAEAKDASVQASTQEPAQEPLQQAVIDNVPAAQHHNGSHILRDLVSHIKSEFPGHSKPSTDGTRGLDLEAEIGKYPQPAPTPGSFTEYIVNVKVPKHVLAQTFRVHVFLGPFDTATNTWSTQDALVGTVVVFGKAETTGCGKCKDDAKANVVITGTIPLTAALLEEYKKGTLGGLGKENVLPWLKKNLHWRVTVADGTEQQREEVPGLKVSVVTTEVALPVAGFPQYSGVYELHPEVTDGRPAGYNVAASHKDYKLILECYHPSAKFYTPYLFCDYIDTPGLSRDDCEALRADENNGSLGKLSKLYSYFRPLKPDSYRRVLRPHPAGGWPTLPPIGLVNKHEELVCQDVYLDSHELFSQLVTTTNIVKLGPKPGVFMSSVNVGEGLTRVWRHWLSECVRCEAQEDEPRYEREKKLLWADSANNVGLRMNVVERKDLEPIVVRRDEDPPVSYTLQYKELAVRTSQLLLMMERSFEQETKHSDAIKKLFREGFGAPDNFITSKERRTFREWEKHPDGQAGVAAGLIVGLVLGFAHRANSANIDLTVDLGYSNYEGTNGNNGVSHWWGIRYAAAPVGDLRFRAPQEPPVNTTLQSANAHGPNCHVSPSTGLSSTNSEDCLFLDVYAPTENNSTPHPVFVWIQGGGFNGLSDLNRDGSGLIAAADHDMVVVTFNYRVGPYGFLASKEVKGNGDLNAGLLDQRKVLRWVQKYIHLFGGDPKHVTIGGASAGGASVDLQLTAYGGRDDGLIHAAAAESQSFGVQFTVSEAQYQYDALVKRVSCNTTADTLKCLRNTDIKTLASNNPNIPNPGGAGGTPVFMWSPVVDGNFTPDFSYNLYAQGKFLKVPAIFGDDTNEGSIFAQPKDSFPTVTSMNNFLKNNFPKLNETHITEIDYLYPEAEQFPSSSTYWRSTSNAYGEMRYNCAGLFVSAAFPNHGVADSWNYHWDVLLPANAANGLGVTHTAEVGSIWGSSSGVEAALIPYIQGYWASFIRTKDPNKLKPSSSPTWETYTGANMQRMHFVNDVKSVGMETVDAGQKTRCAYLNSIGAAVGQ